MFFVVVGSLTSVSPPCFVPVEASSFLRSGYALRRWPSGESRRIAELSRLLSSSHLPEDLNSSANSIAIVDGIRPALWSSRASLNSSLISSYYGISCFSQGKAWPRFKPCSSIAFTSAEPPCFSCFSSHLALLASTQSDKNSWVFTSALTKIVFSYNLRLFMVLRQAKTDSMQSNSASPKDYGRSGFAVERFHEMRDPQALRSLSNNEFDAYFGILLMNTDFFNSFWISAAIRVELSSFSATDFCYFTMAGAF